MTRLTGSFDATIREMAERLREAGYAVVLVDYLGAEGVANSCSGEVGEVPDERVGEYVGAAVSFARTQEFVDPERLVVIGWSRGGVGLLEWFDQLPVGVTPIRAAVAFYPRCASIEPWETTTPLLLLLGGLDDIAPPEVCQDVVDVLPPSLPVTVRVYENGRHGFDFEEGPALVEGDGLTVGRDPEAAAASWREVTNFLNQHLDVVTP